jgi:holliday junction DNA helicase RuvB
MDPIECIMHPQLSKNGTQQDSHDDHALDFKPKQFDDYIGQDDLKKKLSIFTQAAALRNEPLDHLLLFGPPGVGKTTLATIMASVMNVPIKITCGPVLERSGDLIAILSGLEEKAILFIDEIHRMPTAVEEILYSAMEQFSVDVIIGQGAGAKTISLPLNPFTLIGATTKSGMISAPLRSRFGIIERVDFYDDTSLAHIIMQNAHYFQCALNDDAALAIARCARGTPRIAKKLLQRVRDYAQVEGKEIIDAAYAMHALSLLGIDESGLTTLDNLVLKHIVEHFNGGPVGLETIAALVGEDAETIETVVEPFLMRQGLLEKTARGRQIPPATFLKLKKKYCGQLSI